LGDNYLILRETNAIKQISMEHFDEYPEFRIEVWLEGRAKETKNPIIKGFCIINEFIEFEDALPVEYCLN
jgi:hypothetical protein